MYLKKYKTLKHTILTDTFMHEEARGVQNLLGLGHSLQSYSTYAQLPFFPKSISTVLYIQGFYATSMTYFQKQYITMDITRGC
jgi:hypothetical protein